MTRRRNGTGTTTTTAGKNATQVLHSTLVTSINIYHIFSDEEYEWEYIESDEENNQDTKADDLANVTLPTKVRQLPMFFCYFSPFSGGESAEHR